MGELQTNQWVQEGKFYHTPAAARPRLSPPRQDDPDIRPHVPRPAPIVAQHSVDDEARAFEPARHLPHREGAKRQRETMLDASPISAFQVPLLEDRQAPAPVLMNRFDQREVGST